jgi:hypothetical protein
MGRALASPAVPTVFVREGGDDDLERVGPLVLSALRGFEA